MGVTIHYRLGQNRRSVVKLLDDAQAYAQTLKDEQFSKTGVTEFEIVREHPNRLHVEIGGCEWLEFGFGGWTHWEEKGKTGYCYEKNVLERSFNSATLADEDIMWAGGFCKTQYADALVCHKWIADILRFVAGRCRYVEVYDEGEYYHTGVLEDAAGNIEANGKLIEEIGSVLKQNFGMDKVEAGGVTKIKRTKKKP